MSPSRTSIRNEMRALIVEIGDAQRDRDSALRALILKAFEYFTEDERADRNPDVIMSTPEVTVRHPPGPIQHAFDANGRCVTHPGCLAIEPEDPLPPEDGGPGWAGPRK